MRTTTIIGALLIVLGILFLGPTFGLFTLKLIWPAVLLLIGIGFALAYAAAPKLTGLLMPAAILTMSSIPFFICTFSGDWYRMGTLWPIFIFSVSVGLFLMYFLGTKHSGLRTAALILLAFGVVSFLIFNYVRFVFPILFIVAGLVLIFIGLSRKKGSPPKDVLEDTLQNE
jgi:hypothetical protein